LLPADANALWMKITSPCHK